MSGSTRIAVRPRIALLCALASLLAATATPSRGGDGFVADVVEPKVHISIPGLPQMAVTRHPLADAQPHIRLIASDGNGVTVSILVPTADAGMTALECASSSLLSTARRFGLAKEQYVAMKLDETTFAMLFIVPMGEVAQFQAFLFSAAGGTHCVEVHASKLTRDSIDVGAWRRAFEGATISQP